MNYQENKTYTTKYKDQYIDYTYSCGSNDSEWFVISHEEYQRLKKIFVTSTSIKDPAWFLEDIEFTVANDVLKRLSENVTVDDILPCVYVKYVK
jgi:hypothetical protein